MSLRTLLGLALALVVAAPAAASAPPYHPVDEGEVEHRVRTERAEASYTVPGAVPRFVRREEWISRDRYRSTVTDAQTGELIAETVQVGSRVATWDRTEGLWTGTGPSYGGKPRLLGQSFATESAIQRELIAKGWYAKTGENRYESTPDAPSDADTTTTLVLNADFTIVRRESTSRFEDGGWFRQTEETELAETLPAAPAGAFKGAKAKLAKARKARAAKRSYRR